ncbi:MAG: methyltransferase domain-containing protein [Pseudomonadota bacterium]
MKGKFLNDVYGVDTPEAARDLYDDWSTTYDAEIAENGYATPGRVAEALARHMSDRAQPVLDFGCGTGLSGLALRRAGFEVIDGCDLSAEMLKGADDKECYRKTWQIAPGAGVPGGYAAITATGVISVGAAPIETYDILLDALDPGGLLALSFNDHALAEPRFEGKLRARVEDGTTRLLFQEYGTHLPGINLKSNVYVIEKM